MVTIKRKPDFKKNFYEYAAWQRDQLVCGVDEVGRGCLAGPVVTAAVILHTKKISRLVKDSKALTHEERLKCFDWIVKNSWYAVGITHHRFIDRVNIYQATMVAMRRALAQLLAAAERQPCMILIDAVPVSLDFFPGDVVAFPFGESKSISIAAASIVAKITRDHIMCRLEQTFPGYAFAQHKGYGTDGHQKAIKALDRSIIHRMSFLRSFAAGDENQLNFLDAGEDGNTAIWGNC